MEYLIEMPLCCLGFVLFLNVFRSSPFLARIVETILCTCCEKEAKASWLFLGVMFVQAGDRFYELELWETSLVSCCPPSDAGFMPSQCGPLPNRKPLPFKGKQGIFGTENSESEPLWRHGAPDWLKGWRQLQRPEWVSIFKMSSFVSFETCQNLGAERRRRLRGSY